MHTKTIMCVLTCFIIFYCMNLQFLFFSIFVSKVLFDAVVSFVFNFPYKRVVNKYNSNQSCLRWRNLAVLEKGVREKE